MGIDANGRYPQGHEQHRTNPQTRQPTRRGKFFLDGLGETTGKLIGRVLGPFGKHGLPGSVGSIPNSFPDEQ